MGWDCLPFSQHKQVISYVNNIIWQDRVGYQCRENEVTIHSDNNLNIILTSQHNQSRTMATNQDSQPS